MYLSSRFNGHVRGICQRDADIVDLRVRSRVDVPIVRSEKDMCGLDVASLKGVRILMSRVLARK